VFPWASAIAGNFERFRFVKLRFHYVQNCTTSTTGQVALAVDFDSLDDNTMLTKQQLYSFELTARGTSWTSVVLEIPALRLSQSYKSHYIRQTPVSGGDLKTYDPAQVLVAVSGVNSVGAVIGELWVEYEVQLMTPQFSQLNKSDDISLCGHDTTVGYASPSSCAKSEDGTGVKMVLEEGAIPKVDILKPGYFGYTGQTTVPSTSFNNMTSNNPLTGVGVTVDKLYDFYKLVGMNDEKGNTANALYGTHEYVFKIDESVYYPFPRRFTMPYHSIGTTNTPADVNNEFQQVFCELTKDEYDTKLAEANFKKGVQSKLTKVPLEGSGYDGGCINLPDEDQPSTNKKLRLSGQTNMELFVSKPELFDKKPVDGNFEKGVMAPPKKRQM